MLPSLHGILHWESKAFKPIYISSNQSTWNLLYCGRKGEIEKEKQSIFAYYKFPYKLELRYELACGQTSPDNVSWVWTDTYVHARDLMSPTFSKSYRLLHPSGHCQHSMFRRKSHTTWSGITAWFSSAKMWFYLLVVKHGHKNLSAFDSFKI